jgi:hypothetical protein
MLSFESAMALFINLYLIFVIEVAASLEYFDFLRLAPQLLNLNMPLPLQTGFFCLLFFI